MKRATYYVATLMLCGGIITPTAAMAQSFPQPAPASQAAQNPHQVPKPFEVGILKWSQDVYNAGHTTNQAATNCSTRAIGFVEFITASLVHLVVKVTKPVPGYQGITPAPKPANGEINLSNANVLPRD